MNPEFVENAAVQSFVDGIRDWEVQSLVRMHSCKNISAALANALEVEVARTASRRPVMVRQIRKDGVRSHADSHSHTLSNNLRTFRHIIDTTYTCCNIV